MYTYYKPEIQDWIDATWKLIQSMLTLAGIPYEIYDIHEHCHIIRFPWRQGADVAIGILHVNDSMVETNGKNVIRTPYPSIETIGFSWDGDDVTVFSTPVDFLKKIYGEYGRHLQSIKNRNNVHNTWKATPNLESKDSHNSSWNENNSL